MNDKRVVRGKRGVIKERAMNGGRKFEVFWMGQILNLEKLIFFTSYSFYVKWFERIDDLVVD